MTRIAPALLLFIGLTWPLAAQDAVSFRRDIAPILLSKCQACHGPKQSEGGYRVDTYAHAMAAGDSEVAAFIKNRLNESEAFRRLTSDDEDERMPAESDPLPESQIALIKRWIEQGAKYDDEDVNAPLSLIIPARTHPDPPEKYPFPMPITAIEFHASDNEDELFVSGYHEITVWNAQDGTLLRRIRNQGQRTYALSLSPDGKQLAAASGTPGQLGELRLFDGTSGELLAVPVVASDVVLDAAFDPSGKQIALGTADNQLIVWDFAGNERKLTINSHSDWVNAVAWSADGKRIASASRDKTAKVFDVGTGELLITYNGHEAVVHGVAFYPNGKQVLSSDASGKIQSWNVSDGKKSGDIANVGDDVFKLPVHGERFVAPSANQSARLFDMNSKKQIRALEGHGSAVLSAAISPDGKRIATGAYDGVVKFWNAETGEQISSFIAAPGFEAPAE